jgi:Ni/Co efflux regulator RcnB
MSRWCRGEIAVHAALANLTGCIRTAAKLGSHSGARDYGLRAPSTDGLKGDRDMSRIHSIFKQSALAAALALVTLATPAAFAQSQYRGDDRGYYDNRDHHDDRRDHRDYRDGRRDYRDDRRDHRDYRKDARKAYRQDQKNYRRWARGQYIPRDYMASRYYVNDYRDYRLAPPPRGYAWVQPYQNDDTYYMVQIASGLIAQIFNNR